MITSGDMETRLGCRTTLYLGLGEARLAARERTSRRQIVTVTYFTAFATGNIKTPPKDTQEYKNGRYVHISVDDKKYLLTQ
ncbi:hypothetical protein EVAR_23792_1 [Eumeta japonica]|uniref:Uncharacterized protein n=1 Tax=Eumeta variegata TaxID=151549 RepID=A0A4C1VLJ5_EUMVA|nr:hypothetical protein EVAR_23792_1 [Eumeta japonica]